MSESKTTTEKFNPTEALRNLHPGDAPVVTDIKHYKVVESTRVREKKASGARFNITRNEAAGIIVITCIERPQFFSPHGITFKAKYIGAGEGSRKDQIFILRMYTQVESLMVYSQDGVFSKSYGSIMELLEDWSLPKFN